MNNLEDMNSFIERLSALKEFASLNGGFVSRDNIKEAFPELNESQNALLEEYLEKNHIGIDNPIDSDSFLSASDNGYLNLYLEELEELEDVDNDKRRVLIMGALNNDAKSKEELMNSYLKNIVDIAKLYAGQGASLQDLIGEGNVALAIAVNMINCVETIEDVDALIVKSIMNAMEDFVGIESENAKSDEKALALVVKVTDKAKEMYEDLYRKVTVDELSKESGISKKKILEAIRITDKCLEYIEKPEEEN